MVDIRIYIGTLVAVLVFFGLGVLVGIGVTREPRAEQLYLRIEQQLKRYREETAKELQKRDEQIKRLEGEISLLQTRLKSGEQFLEKLAPALVRDSLKFRNIALISLTTSSDNGLAGRLQSFLQKAGANIPFRASLNPEAFNEADTETWREVAARLGLIVQNNSDDAIRMGVWKRLALAVRFGDSQGCWKVLSEFGWAKAIGDLQTPVGSVVLICTDETPREVQQVKSVDISFLQSLRGVGVRVVVVSTTETGEKVLAPYRATDLPTIDHVDTPLGLLSLVAVLLGHQDHYGFGELARRPFPEPEWLFQPRS